jgi:hypothetical protein
VEASFSGKRSKNMSLSFNRKFPCFDNGFEVIVVIGDRK